MPLLISLFVAAIGLVLLLTCFERDFQEYFERVPSIVAGVVGVPGCDVEVVADGGQTAGLGGACKVFLQSGCVKGASQKSARGGGSSVVFGGEWI